MLLKNNFNPKAVLQLMRHAKEIITIDVYGNTAEIIEDCLDELQPFIDDLKPEPEEKKSTEQMFNFVCTFSIYSAIL